MCRSVFGKFWEVYSSDTSGTFLKPLRESPTPVCRINSRTHKFPKFPCGKGLMRQAVETKVERHLLGWLIFVSHLRWWLLRLSPLRLSPLRLPLRLAPAHALQASLLFNPMNIYPKRT
jgi:hypothetical protein